MNRFTLILLCAGVALLAFLLISQHSNGLNTDLLLHPHTHFQDEIQHVFLSKTTESPIGCIIHCKITKPGVKPCKWEEDRIREYATRVFEIPQHCLTTHEESLDRHQGCNIYNIFLPIDVAMKHCNDYETILDDSASSGNDHIVFILVPAIQRNKVDSFTPRFLQRIDSIIVSR